MSTSVTRYILIIGSEFPLRERALAGALRAGGGTPVYTLAKSRQSTTIKFFDGYITGDLTDPEGVVAATVEHAARTGAQPAAVVPVNDFAVRSALAVAQHFGLNHNPEAAVDCCRDKFVMKEVLSAAGLPVPRFSAFSTLEELQAVAGRIGFPLVIKPRELTGSLGVVKVPDANALADAYQQCMAGIRSLSGDAETPPALLQAEEYIPARAEVSVEVFNHGDLHRVVAVTDKYLGPEPHFVETGHSVPSVYTDDTRLRDMAEHACKALGIRYGMAHFEARITPAGDIRIIEVAARTGGDSIMDLVERVYGVNPYELHVASFLGRAPNVPTRPAARGLAAVAFLKTEVGVIQSISLPKFLPYEVVNMQVSAKPNDVSEKLTSWRNREGSVEFFWPGRKPEPGFDEHLRMAARYSGDIFGMRSVQAA
ncbi:MAG: ATP-grasp domain-containing protein [Ramlibacter sp.]|nr:ATP-grasp domain-containing protein [Ramlibacter sp.]